jgi:hypothetical protein
MENPAPVIEAELTVTAELPEEVRVTDFVVGVFTTMPPKFTLVVLTDNCVLAVEPVPLRATAAVPAVLELLLMVSCPETDPAVVGLN